MKNVRNYKLNSKQYAYILDAITLDNYGMDADAMSDTEKVAELFKVFDEEYSTHYEKRRYPNSVERLANWFRGLPSVFNIAFDDASIIETGKSWGYCQTDQKAAAFVENWWNAIAAKTFQLARLLGVDVSKY